MALASTLEGDGISQIAYYSPITGTFKNLEDTNLFGTRLYSLGDILEQNELSGDELDIVSHLESEDILLGEDGYLYADTYTDHGYLPIGKAIFDGEEDEEDGLLGKFKLPKFKMPGKKKKGGMLKKPGMGIVPKSIAKGSLGKLATKGFRTFNPVGMLSKKGLIGRNLKALKNPFKSLNPFKSKGGKSGGLDQLMEMQEMIQPQEQSPEDIIQEESNLEPELEQEPEHEPEQEYDEQAEEPEYEEQPLEGCGNCTSLGCAGCALLLGATMPSGALMSFANSNLANTMVKSAGAGNKTLQNTMKSTALNSISSMGPYGAAAGTVLNLADSFAQGKKQAKQAKKEKQKALLMNFIQKAQPKPKPVSKAQPKPVSKIQPRQMATIPSPPTTEFTASTSPSSGGNTGLIVGGVIVAGGLLYFITKK